MLLTTESTGSCLRKVCLYDGTRLLVGDMWTNSEGRKCSCLQVCQHSVIAILPYSWLLIIFQICANHILLAGQTVSVHIISNAGVFQCLYRMRCVGQTGSDIICHVTIANGIFHTTNHRCRKQGSSGGQKSP